MAQPQPIAASISSERLSWLDIMERYRYEWVCLVEIEKLDGGLEVESARVVGRGKTRQEALDDAAPYHSQVCTPVNELAPYFSRPFVHLTRRVAPEWEAPEPVGPPFISGPMTWEEIRERYPDQWVCLVEIDEVNETDFEFRTARVVGHGKTRRGPLVQAEPYLEHYRDFARYHTGVAERSCGGHREGHAL